MADKEKISDMKYFCCSCLLPPSISPLLQTMLRAAEQTECIDEAQVV